MAIEDSSEASLLGIKVSVMIDAFEVKADRISRASENAKRELVDYINISFKRVADVVAINR